MNMAGEGVRVFVLHPQSWSASARLSDLFGLAADFSQALSAFTPPKHRSFRGITDLDAEADLLRLQLRAQRK